MVKMAELNRPSTVTPHRYYAHITGWGMCVPEHIFSNADLSAILETNDEWIRTRTGIQERRFADEDQTTSTLALKAAQQALSLTDVLPSEIDLIIVATCTPENIFPATAVFVQHWLGANQAGAFDISAACSGFLYGLNIATQAIRSGSIKVALIIGAETLSRVINWEDRGTAILFGDGAGAVVLEAREEEGGIISTLVRADGSGHDFLKILTHNHPEIRSKAPFSDLKIHKVYMSGGDVFKFASRILGEAVREVIDRAKMSLEDIRLIIPHQANARILQAAARSLNVPESLLMSNLERYGNTSAASIPLALCEAVREGRIAAGDNIVLVGFGGGLTWAAAVVKWMVGEPAVDRRKEGRRRAGYALVKVRTRWYRVARFGRWFLQRILRRRPLDE